MVSSSVKEISVSSSQSHSIFSNSQVTLPTKIVAREPAHAKLRGRNFPGQSRRERQLCADRFPAHNGGMEECPLIKEFRRNPKAAMEFADNHARLPLWTRLLNIVFAKARGFR